MSELAALPSRWLEAHRAYEAARALPRPRPSSSGTAAAASPAVAAPTSADLAEDERILRLARGGNNSTKFTRLWGGDWAGRYPSHSEADAALVQILVFWMDAKPGDDAAVARLDRLFRRSALVRDKWTGRADYRRRTIARAIELHREQGREEPRNLRQWRAAIERCFSTWERGK